tara:strand:+ start:420 stop:629 length:210 start_codon:yes stop_codon:yes gene_type:complete
MKLLILKNSILLLRIKPDSNTVDCYFIFLITWNCFKNQEHTFSFADITMTGIKQFYKTLADDWTGIYRI